MNQRANFLALILLDALDDEDENNVYKILERNDVDASFVACERGIAPLHFACGMQNERLAQDITKRFLESGANPNVRTIDNMTALHVAAIYGRVEIVKMLLKFGADLNVFDNERKLPVHYAIEEFHFDLVQLMRDHIFLTKCEQKKITPQHQAAEVQNVLNMTDHKENSVLSQTKFNLNLLRSDTKRVSTPNRAENPEKSKNLTNKLIADNEASLNASELTPNRVHYNYDVTSPYYIHITHRRNKPQPAYPASKLASANDEPSQQQQSTNTENNWPDCSTTEAVNIFSLTRENLQELTQHSSQVDRSRISFIETWRERVRRSRARKSILQEYDNVADLIDNVMQSDELNFTNTALREKDTNKTNTEQQNGSTVVQREERKLGATQLSLGGLIKRIAEAQLAEDHPVEFMAPISDGKETESSYRTVPEIKDSQHNKTLENSTNFIKSPTGGEFYLQMTEAYVHTDDENGLVFYETKLISNRENALAEEKQNLIKKQRKQLAVLDTTTTSQSTNITVPLDYETDELRAELTTFGEPPGPITKTTKRLYIKRLVKYKRKTQLLQLKAKQADIEEKKFSVELHRTLRSEETFQKVTTYLDYERQSTAYFANNKNAAKMREGHLKQSFIYMLIDPRISCNLPGESAFLDKFIVWKRFLKSIFYVGKGKCSRPYAHLYEAMKTHSRMHLHEAQKEINKDSGRKALLKNRIINVELFKSPPPCASESKKLDRILGVWASNMGVVCLHVFHNILPSEAYTREAAIIDALSLQHLTNIKRGQYYGPAKTWTMKEKKCLGIALLYKAMSIYIAEGESQLSPSDLI